MGFNFSQSPDSVNKTIHIYQLSVSFFGVFFWLIFGYKFFKYFKKKKLKILKILKILKNLKKKSILVRCKKIFQNFQFSFLKNLCPKNNQKSELKNTPKNETLTEFMSSTQSTRLSWTSLSSSTLIFIFEQHLYLHHKLYWHKCAYLVLPSREDLAKDRQGVQRSCISELNNSPTLDRLPHTFTIVF